jgi:hypothetical protein
MQTRRSIDCDSAVRRTQVEQHQGVGMVGARGFEPPTSATPSMRVSLLTDSPNPVLDKNFTYGSDDLHPMQRSTSRPIGEHREASQRNECMVAAMDSQSLQEVAVGPPVAGLPAAPERIRSSPNLIGTRGFTPLSPLLPRRTRSSARTARRAQRSGLRMWSMRFRRASTVMFAMRV